MTTFCLKIFDINKIRWHNLLISLHLRNRQLHHGCKREGVCGCCPATFVALTNKEHNDQKILNEWTEALRERKREVMNNYVKNMGCREKLFDECEWCAMPLAPEFEKRNSIKKDLTIDIKNVNILNEANENGFKK